MGNENWGTKFIKSLLEFKKTQNVSKLKNKFDEILQSDSTKQKDLIRDAVALLTTWLTSAPQPIQGKGNGQTTNANQREENPEIEVVRVWNALLKNLREIPINFVSFFVKSMPKNEQIDWYQVLKRCNHESLLDSILAAKHLQQKALRKKFRESPHCFFNSVVLDRYLDDLDADSLRSIWEMCLEGNERPSNLYSRQELMYFITLDWSKFNSNTSFLANFLLSDHDDTRSLVSRYFNEAEFANAFCAVIAQATLQTEKLSAITDSLKDTFTFVRELIDENEKNFSSGVKTLCFGILLQQALSTEIISKTDTIDFLRKSALKSLLAIEQDQSDEKRNALFLLTAKDLYELCSDFINSLGKIARNVEFEINRKDTAIESKVKLDLLRELVCLIDFEDDGPNPSRFQQKLEEVLFNNGVRRIGEPDQLVIFESRKHVSNDSLVFPQEEVIIRKVGFFVGDDENAIILKKAQVISK